MNPDMWQNAWEHVCNENTFLVMKEYEADHEIRQCPYCTLYSKWAEVSHLLSDKCGQERQSYGYAQDGPLLAAILKAEQLAGTVPQQPVPLQHGGCEQVSGTTPQLPAPLAFGERRRFAHATRSVCPKEGCGLRAGSRSSRTHCCRRCEMAHVHGHRLKRDPGPGPTAGEVYKKIRSRLHRSCGP